MRGPIKIANSVVDALTLQYYEETDPVKAAFGHELSREDWLNEAGEAFYKVSMVYQSTEQLREYTRLSLDNPPVKTAIVIDGLTNADGMIAEADLFARLDSAIDAYDQLVEQYSKQEELSPAA